MTLVPALSSCSLSLEDPEVEARKKLAKLIPTTWELLEGRWIGDSTYTLFDTRADRLDKGMVVDLFPDSTWWVGDSGKAVFPSGASIAPIRLSSDTLFVAATRSGAPDTFLVRMRFLGNYLELFRASDQRSTHFHKLKPFDSTRRETLLDSGTWVRRAYRSTFDTVRREALRRDFDYLLFPGDSMTRDTRRDGLTSVESGPLSRDGRRFAWTPGGTARALHLDLDLYHADSLRVWVLSAGRADSGYSLYTRAPGRAQFDLDMTPYAAHLRTDTVKTPFTATETHFGRHYDVVLGRDHKVEILSNMPSMPRYRAWSIDSGFLWLEDAASIRTRFSVTALTRATLRIACDSNRDFSRPTTLAMSVVDGTRFAAQPLERFDQAGYMHIAVGSDTMKHYWFNIGTRNNPEDHEIAALDSTDTLWSAWRVNPSLETFGSSQAGFLFAFHGRNAALGQFTCRSRPDLGLALRSTASSDPTLARGLVQGSCRITASQSPPADSTLAITGEFRSKRRGGNPLAPFWRAP